MATGRDLRARLHLTLRDGATEGLSRIEGRFQRLRSAIRRLSIASAVVGGLALAPAVARAAELEGQLRAVAVTAGTMGEALPAEIGRIRATLNRAALDFRGSTAGLLGAMEVLSARGFATENMETTIRDIARLRAASGAAETDIAELLVTLDRISGIRAPEAQMRAMAQAFRAGQLGGVELRDMARYMPGVLGQLDALGVRGERGVQNAAAMFQVLRDGFGSVPEAAAGLSQLLGHLLSDGTVRQMSEFGVNLRGVYQSALAQAARGVDIDPVEAILQKFREVLASDPARIFQLVPDQNARQALQALLPNIQRYLDMRQELRRTEAPAVDQSAADQLVGLAAEWRRLTEIMAQLTDRVGRVGEAVLPILNEQLERFLRFIGEIDGDYPGLIDNTLSWLAGMVGLAVTLGIVGQAVSFLSAGLTLLLAPLQLVFTGLSTIVGVPIAAFLAALALIGGAAYLIWRYWDRIGPWFRWLWRTISGWFTDFVDWISGWAASAYAGAIAIIQGAWLVLRTWFNTLWNTWVREPFEAFVTWVDGWTGGLASAAIDRIIQSWGRLKQGFRDLWNDIKAIFEGIWGPIERAMERAERFFVRENAGAARYQPGAQAELGRRMGYGGAQRIPDSEWNAPEAAAPARPVDLQGRVLLELAPGLVAREANTNLPNVDIVATPDRGATRSRP